MGDLGNAYNLLGGHLQLHGNPLAKELFQKSIKQYAAAASLQHWRSSSMLKTG